MNEEKKSEPDKLHWLIGEWKTTGEVFADDNNSSIEFSGTDTYEWILDNTFILHSVDVMMDNENVKALELIGEYDQSIKQYTLRSFDNSGNYAVMHAFLTGGNNLQITGEKIRAEMKVIENGKLIKASWEKSDDNNKWQPWMKLILSK
jgi:hypothetical protein